VIEELGWSLVERELAAVIASDGHRTTRPAHLDEAYRLARERVGERALSLFDGSALGDFACDVAVEERRA
jgi:tyrosine-protein phosphatase YwqE